MAEMIAEDPNSQYESGKKRLSQQLAQQSSNSNYATRQGNQLAQDQFFQPEGPDATTGQGIEESADAGGQPPAQPVTSPVPQATPGPVATFPGQTASNAAVSTQPAPSPTPAQTSTSAKDLAMQILGEMYAKAKPDSAGAKGKAQDYLTSMNQQAIEQMKQSAASRGVSGGWVGGTEAEMLSGLGPQLTGAYRDIDLQDQNQYFANLLATLGGAQGLGQLDLGYGQLGLGYKDLDLRRELGLGGLGLQRDSLDVQKGIAANDANDAFWRNLAYYLGGS